MRKRTRILLVLAVIIAFLLRFWKLSSLPYPPDGDEVAFGYYGWSLLHFGTDEYGNKFPLSFQSIGDFKYPGLVYLNILPSLIFGLNNIATRAVSAFSGVILIALIYYFVKLLFEDETISVIASFLAAINPWSIIESRLGYESHASMVLVLAAAYFLLSAIKKKSRNICLSLIFSFILFLTASLTYGAERIFIPAFLFLIFVLSFVYKKQFGNQKKILGLFLITLTVIIGAFLLFPQNRGRATEDMWKRISAAEENRLAELYVGAGTSPIKIPARITWLFNNKYRIAVFDFLDRYLNHFSPKFLFINGEATLQRIPDMGVLLIIDCLLLPLGLIYMIKMGNSLGTKIVIGWLILAPIASSLTADTAMINRATLMIPPLVIFSAFGVRSAVSYFRRKMRIVAGLGLSILVTVSSLFSLNQIFIQKPFDAPWYKQTVNEELTKEILNLKGNYKAVVTQNDDYIFFLFYGKISPSDFLANSDISPLSNEKWERVNRFENIYFKMPFDCPKSGKLGVLYVCKGGNIPQNSKIIKTIYYPDGLPAYSLIEFFPISEIQKPLPTLTSGLHYMVEVEKKVEFSDGIIPDSYPSYW